MSLLRGQMSLHYRFLNILKTMHISTHNGTAKVLPRSIYHRPLFCICPNPISSLIHRSEVTSKSFDWFCTIHVFMTSWYNSNTLDHHSHEEIVLANCALHLWFMHQNNRSMNESLSNLILLQCLLDQGKPLKNQLFNIKKIGACRGHMYFIVNVSLHSRCLINWTLLCTTYFYWKGVYHII